MTRVPDTSPANPEFVAVATAWRSDGIIKLLRYVWAGYCALRAENPPTLDTSDEVNINSHLESWIQRKKPKNCPFHIQHTPPEPATRRSPSRPPPTPDFGFFPWSDCRAMFPLEAKVLQTDGDLSKYLKALRLSFLQCRYAPHSSEGAMIGYLLAGDAQVVFEKLGSKLHAQLERHSAFPTQPHRCSEHERKHRRCRNCPLIFRCHHLILIMSNCAM
jgi:hypothetical protein